MKSVVIKLLRERGLSMQRRTLPDGKRAWVISDGRAFPSLKSVYGFYARKENQSPMQFLLDKFRDK